MTDDELAAIEAHAQAVDSRMSENCLRLLKELREADAEAEYWRQQRNDILRQRDRLREALREYGRHATDCDACHSERLLCTCGLADLVA